MATLITTPDELAAVVEGAVRKVMAEAGATDVLSVAQAARIADRSQDRIRVWIAEGLLPAQKRGKVWAIKRADLDRYLSGETSDDGPSTDDLVTSLASRR